MPLRIAQIIKIPITLATIVVLVFGFVCVGMFSQASMNMADMNMGMMSGDQASQCCTLGTMHHLDSWKNIISVTPDKIRDALLVLTFSLALVFGLSWLSSRRRPLVDPEFTRLRLYLKYHPDLVLFNHLKLAFARGILNTKVY